MQSACRTAHSTESALLRVQNDIPCQLDNQDVVILVFLDLSVVFDTVGHDNLFKVLEKRFSVWGSALRWIKWYLGNRSSSGYINKCLFSSTRSIFRMPQGFTLGPSYSPTILPYLQTSSNFMICLILSMQMIRNCMSPSTPKYSPVCTILSHLLKNVW